MKFKSLPPVSVKLPRVRWAGPRMSLRLRLGLGFGVVLALLAAIGGMGWVLTGSLNTRLQGLMHDDYARVESVTTMQVAVDAMMNSIYASSVTDDRDEMKFNLGEVQKRRALYQAAAKALNDQVASVGAADALRKPLDELNEISDNNAALMDEFIKQAGMGASASAMMVFASSQIGPQHDKWDAALSALRLTVADSMRNSAAQAQRGVTTGRMVTAAAVLASLLLGTLAAALISRSIALPLSQAADLSRRVADGDLTTVLPEGRGDEIGTLFDSLRHMQESLRRLISEIRLSAENIGAATADVATGSLDLSRRTETMVSGLQETAASVEQLTDAVRQNADSSGAARALATGASDAAENGGKVVSEVVASMGGITDSSRKIADIVGVIEGIAFQTNILALNAAVEAARAGEQGRGFAVVAGEVRNLAQRAGSSANEIKTLIADSVARVESGTRLVNDAGSTMQKIVHSVRSVSAVIGQIATATVEQNDSVQNVNGAIRRIDEMTQQNAAMVEQSSAAADALRDQAMRLNDLVDAFKL